jgi:hypothetical protein
MVLNLQKLFVAQGNSGQKTHLNLFLAFKNPFLNLFLLVSTIKFLEVYGEKKCIKIRRQNGHLFYFLRWLYKE